MAGERRDAPARGGGRVDAPCPFGGSAGSREVVGMEGQVRNNAACCRLDSDVDWTAAMIAREHAGRGFEPAAPGVPPSPGVSWPQGAHRARARRRAQRRHGARPPRRVVRAHLRDER